MAAAVNGVTGTSQTASTSTTTKTDAAATQDRFLKLLVAQMQNQDPLNPMDNAAVTTQMAQIQTVQGIQSLNDTLKANTEAQSFQSVGLIGKHILAPGSFMDMASGAGYGGFDLGTAADDVTVTITDSNKQLVRTLKLGKQDAGSNMFSWDGKNDAGTLLSDGTYTFNVKATQAGGSVSSTNLSVDKVDSVVMDSTGTKLNTAGFGNVDMSTIRMVL